MLDSGQKFYPVQTPALSDLKVTDQETLHYRFGYTFLQSVF